MVRVGRMAQAEHQRDDDHHTDRRPGGEGSDSLVETEHHVTFGSAWAVIRTPARRITAALSAGSDRSTTPSKRARANARFAPTATRPTAVIASASPRLKATI